MINKLKKIILAAFVVLLFVSINPISVQAAIDGDWTFKILADGTAEITSYSGTATSINLPSQVIYNGNAVAVTSIGDNLFYSTKYKSITQLTIPEGIKKLGYYSLYGIKVTELIIPSTVEYIDSSALPKDNYLTLRVAPNNKVYDSRDNCNAVIETATDTLIVGCLSTVIPGSVKTIGSYAFSSEDLTEIIIPEGVTTIKSCAFRYNKATKLSISSTVTSIATNAFESSYYLESITVAPANKVFDSRNDCNAIMVTATNTLFLGAVNTVIPADTVTIGSYAFCGNIRVPSLVIPSGVTTIEVFALSGLSNCETVFIPDTVTSIGNANFSTSMNKTIICTEGSFAEKFAIDNDLPYETCPIITMVMPDDIKPGDDLIKKMTETAIKYNGKNCNILLASVNMDGENLFVNAYNASNNGWVYNCIDDYIAANSSSTEEELAKYKDNATAKAGVTYNLAVINLDFTTTEKTTTLENLVTIEGGKYATVDTLFYDSGYGVSLKYKVSDLNGINYAGDGKWYYYKNGVVDTSFNGLAYYKNNNAWYYFTNGELDKKYSGLSYMNGNWWYVKNGTINKTYTGLVFYENDWWYVTNGKYDKTYKGVTAMNGNIWFIRNGRIDKTTSGIWQQDGNIYYITKGKVDTSVYSLEFYNGAWYYFRAGVVDWSYNNLAYANNAWWYIKNGKLDKSYTGLFLYNGKLWYINQGKLDKTYAGTTTYNGHTYSVKDGIGTLIK